jgi:hypothetical protein
MNYIVEQPDRNTAELFHGAHVDVYVCSPEDFVWLAKTTGPNLVGKIACMILADLDTVYNKSTQKSQEAMIYTAILKVHFI